MPMQETEETRVWALCREDPPEWAWQPTRVFLPRESHRQRSLAGYSPWGLQRVRHDWSDLARTHNIVFISEYNSRVSSIWRSKVAGCCTHSIELSAQWCCVSQAWSWMSTEALGLGSAVQWRGVGRLMQEHMPPSGTALVPRLLTQQRNGIK